MPHLCGSGIIEVLVKNTNSWHFNLTGITLSILSIVNELSMVTCLYEVRNLISYKCGYTIQIPQYQSNHKPLIYIILICNL